MNFFISRNYISTFLKFLYSLQFLVLGWYLKIQNVKYLWIYTIGKNEYMDDIQWVLFKLSITMSYCCESITGCFLCVHLLLKRIMAWPPRFPAHPTPSKASPNQAGSRTSERDWEWGKWIQDRYSRVSGRFLEGSSLEVARVCEVSKLRRKMGILKSFARIYMPPSLCGRNRKQRTWDTDIIHYCIDSAFLTTMPF